MDFSFIDQKLQNEIKIRIKKLEYWYQAYLPTEDHKKIIDDLLNRLQFIIEKHNFEPLKIIQKGCIGLLVRGKYQQQDVILKISPYQEGKNEVET